jgi:ABC-type uncharacterized transport system substrate-binding protein
MRTRRAFITLLGGAAAAWPLAARAQQRDRVRRVGVLTALVEGDPELQRRIVTFQLRLRELGWIEGRNLRMDIRSGGGDSDLVRAAAAELVSLKPDVILVNSSSVMTPLRQQTSTIPIVFVQINDPLGSGIVASLAHPGGNVTGFTPAEFSIGGKQLDTLKEAVPNMKGVLVVLDPALQPHVGMLRVIEASAAALGLRVSTTSSHDGAEIERAANAFPQRSGDGLLVLGNPTATVHRMLIIGLAAKYRMPAIYPFRFFVTEGGLMSYGTDPADQYRQAASYIDRILNGANPGDLPVQAPTRFELVINLKTAKMLGIEVPPLLLARADEVIE